MITKVTRTDVLRFSSRIIAGIFANPASGNLTNDLSARQQIISQTVQDTINAFLSMGIAVVDDDEI